MVSAVPTSDLNLAPCAREAIRHSVIEAAGSIQPHGILNQTFTVRVEDDADVRAFTVETVRELGYDVLEARDGMQLITKPFAFEDLAARVRGVLDSQDSSRHVN